VILQSGAASTTPLKRVDEAAPRWQDMLVRR